MFGSATGGSLTVHRDTRVIQCMRRQAYGCARAQCKATLQLRETPNPPLHINFNAEKLPPSYHYIGCSIASNTTIGRWPAKRTAAAMTRPPTGAAAAVPRLRAAAAEVVRVPAVGAVSAAQEAA